ncbi:MAG: 4-hydroxy-tetrahydrodipicolinate synthase [Bacteroidetes bacterium]|nr:MAG: 4-hydroxy-tetrahydrodipicolinate synthase [Bacteroidota bacterium]
MNKFRGTGVALVTPFDKNGNVDFHSLENVINHVIKGGVEYVVSLGTTGETPALTSDEKVAVVKHTIKTANKRVPVVAGIGGNSTQEVINTIKKFDFKGVDAVLSVSPYYNKPNQRGIYEHYKAVAAACPLPIIVYNVPGRTSSNITAETTLKLAHEITNIIAVKEASGNMDQMMQIIKHKPKDFLVISGDDLITLPIIASGGEGVISVIANAFPHEFSEMTRQSLAGNFENARKFHYTLDEFTRLIFADGNPSGVKCVLNMMKITLPYVRLPLVQVNPQVENALKAEYSGYKKTEVHFELR